MKRQLTVNLILSMALFMGTYNNLFSQTGIADTTFNSDGRVTISVESKSSRCYGLATQEDGKIVAVGFNGSGSAHDMAVVRLHYDGILDYSFNTDGIVATDFDTTNDMGRAVAVQPDGKIVVAGHINNGGIGDDFAVLRYHGDGILDYSFSGDGKVTTDFDTYSDLAFDVAIQPDGKILVGGYANISGNGLDFALLRYHGDGILDYSFSGDGKVTTDFGNNNHDQAYAIALQPDGKIIMAGYTYNGSDEDIALLRYHADGILDYSFGINGKVVTDINNTDNYAKDVQLQSDGKIVITGYADNGPDHDIVVARYHADGTLDYSFSGDGKLTTDLGGADDLAQSLIVQPDGKIVVSGYSDDGSGNDMFVLRYHADGILDYSFSGDGIDTLDFNNSDDLCFTSALTPDGKIVLGGFSDENGSYDMAVVQYLSGLNVGILEIDDLAATTMVYPNPILSSAALEFELLKEEVLIIELLDVKGQIVQEIMPVKAMPAGKYQININLDSQLPSGTYFIRIGNNRGYETIKIMKS